MVVLLCVFGLVGLPDVPDFAGPARDNFSKRIKLGLDLQGGTHLILQVQVNEAVSLQTDQTIDHLSTQLRDKNIRYDELAQGRRHADSGSQSRAGFHRRRSATW